MKDWSNARFPAYAREVVRITHGKTLTDQMQEALDQAMRTMPQPDYIRIPGGLWLRRKDRLVSWDLDTWIEPGERELALIFDFADKLGMSDA